MNLNLDLLFKIERIQEIFDKDCKKGKVKTVRRRNSKLSASMPS